MEDGPTVHLTETLWIDDIAYTQAPIFFSVDPQDLNSTYTNPVALSVDSQDLNNSEFDKDTRVQDVYSFEKLEPYQRKELLERDAIAKLKLSMEKLTRDGKVLKKIEKEGYGEIPAYDTSEDRYLIKYYYAAYTEFNDLPFDICARRLHKPAKVLIGVDNIIEGLKIALKSMKHGEKSHFLIGPSLAYRNGAPPRIPKQATVLFIVELLSIEIHNEDENNEPSFHNIIEEVAKILKSGATMIGKGDNKHAIEEYRKAEALLWRIHYANQEEEEEGNKQLIIIYSNLAICYNANQEYRKTCSAFNTARQCSPNLADKNIKLLYNSSKALRMLGDFKEAKYRLLKAQNLYPDCKGIQMELNEVNKSAINALKKEIVRCQNMLGFKTKNPDPDVTKFLNDNEEFAAEVREILKQLKVNSESEEFDISGFTVQELECFKTECRRQKVRIRDVGSDVIVLIPNEL